MISLNKILFSVFDQADFKMTTVFRKSMAVESPERTYSEYRPHADSLDLKAKRAHYSNSLIDIKKAEESDQPDRPRMVSILKSRRDKGDSMIDAACRKDSQGVCILNGSKKHHICFKSEIKEEKLVESYKKYNRVEEGGDCLMAFFSLSCLQNMSRMQS